MKSIMIMLFVVLISTTAIYSQKITTDKVPPSVINAFKVKFPSAIKAKWELEKADYEVRFKLDKVEYSATFDKDGKWMETENEIEVSKLPNSVSQTLAKQFADYKIKEAELSDSFDKGKIFEVELIKGKEILEVQLSPNGDVLKKEVENKEKD